MSFSFSRFRAYLTVLGGRYVLATISFCVRRLPDSSTLKTSFADGGKCSIFVLVDSFLVSAKSIPHLQFTCPLPTTPSIIKPVIAAIIAYK